MILTWTFLCFDRDIDVFIEHLESTVSFFATLEGGNETSGEDDFVPFI